MAEATKTTTRKPAARKPQDRKPKVTDEVVVQGITLSVPKEKLSERLADWDVIEGIATMNDASASPIDRMVSVSRVLKTLFESDYERVKAELRAAHDGKLTEEIMGDFMRDAFEALSPNS